MKPVVNKLIKEFESSPERIKQILKSAGSKIGSVHFIKRSTGELRKMSYRIGVRKPSCAPVPSGRKDRATKKAQDSKKNIMTVLDVNKVVYDKDGNKIGRGAWRSISLDSVTQITANGKTYVIQRIS